MGQETITLKEEEMKKVLVDEKVIHHYLTVREAAELPEISPRQVLRLKKCYLKEGARGMVHKNRGRKPVHAISDAVKEQINTLPIPVLAVTGCFQGSIA
jgi:predicted transcriptional regulator of viral defense system